MSPIAQRIARAVYENSPRLLCFPCLAAQLGLKEHDVRAVALVLIMRTSLRLVQLVVCSRCQRSAEALVAQNLA